MAVTVDLSQAAAQLESSKDYAKAFMARHGIPTAAYQVFTPWTIQRNLEYPLFVKPVSEDASIGITRASRVENVEQLKVQVEHEIKEFGRALVEEFIEGREFTCLIAENPDDPEHPRWAFVWEADDGTLYRGGTYDGAILAQAVTLLRQEGIVALGFRNGDPSVDMFPANPDAGAECLEFDRPVDGRSIDGRRHGGHRIGPAC